MGYQEPDPPPKKNPLKWNTKKSPFGFHIKTGSKHFSIFIKIIEKIFTSVFHIPADCPLSIYLVIVIFFFP